MDLDSLHPSPPTKLPIKRRSNHHPATAPFATVHGGDHPAPPTLPFKFHRIWTEPDEISFLQCLINCISKDNLTFPRDQQLFYAKFSSETRSHPYTKSQLCEKLRRLRKKFRAMNARIARGVDVSSLCSHDRALFELSKKVWQSKNLSDNGVSNNGSENDFNHEIDECSLIGVVTEQNEGKTIDKIEDKLIQDVSENSDRVNKIKEDVNEVKANYDLRNSRIPAKLVIGVFDETLQKMRKEIVSKWFVEMEGDGFFCTEFLKKGVEMDFRRRWREQRAAEMDVLARRWRLVLENSLHC